MKLRTLAGLVQTAAALAVLTGGMNASAQSADALIDKLVEKGILTVKEATELREETDKNFATAYSAKSGMPEWVTALKFNGDLRGRYDGIFFDNDAPVDRHRYRYRLRFGATVTMFDNMEVGLRLSSAEPASGGGNGGDPISGNATFQDNASRKFIYLDLVYGKWTPINTPKWSVTGIIGKMENPFVVSDMVFDPDYTPEGAAIQVAYNFNDAHTARLNVGAFLIDEVSTQSEDPYWYAGQLRFDSMWTKKLQTSFGVAAMTIVNDEFLNATRSSTIVTPGSGGNALGTNTTTSWTVPNQNVGNLRSPVSGTSGSVGRLLNNYNPILVDGAVTYTLSQFWHYNAPFPIRLTGEYMHNPGADDQNSAWCAGISFGKAGKRGLWEISYRYKNMPGDFWFEEFVDSDFGAFYQSGSARSGGAAGYAAGTNIRGHVVKGSYSPFDSLTFSVTAYIAELIQESPGNSVSDTTRIQVDAMWKF